MKQDPPQRVRGSALGLGQLISVNRMLRTWFGLAFGVGLGAVVLGALLGLLWLTVAVPLGAMILYMLGGLRVHRSNIMSHQFADSIYYLGFLFTLVALLVALVELGLGDSTTDNSALLGKFGVALSTTVLGLLARVLLISFQGTIEDEEQRMTANLVEAGEALRQHFEQMSLDMLSLNELINRSLRQAIDTTAAQLTSATDSSSSTLRKANQRLNFILETAVRDFQESLREALRSLGASTEEMSRELRDGVKTTVESVEQATRMLDSSIRNLALPVDIFEIQLRPPLEALKAILHSHGEQIESLTSSQREVESRIKAFSGSLGAISGHTEMAVDAMKSLGGATEPARQLRVEFEELAGSLRHMKSIVEANLNIYESQSSAVSETRREIEEQFRMIADLRTKLEEHVRSASEMLGAMNGQLSEAAGLLREELGGNRVPD